MKISVQLALSLFGIACLSITWGACSSGDTVSASIQGDIKKSFSVQPGGRLFMDVEPGSIEVKTTSDSQIAVEVFRKVERAAQARGEEILRQHEVTFEQTGNDLIIRAKAQNDGFKLWRRHSLNVRYLVSIPTEFNVDLKTSGGSVSVSDLRGEVRARTSGGSLNFGKIEGPVIGDTSGGSINLVGCKGKTELNTSGGSIDIGSGAGEMTAKTSGGSIKIDNFNGNVFARTSGGDIKANSIAGAIDASTSGGSVSVSIKGQPGKDSRLHTSGGGITVEIEENVALNIDAEASGGSVSTELPVMVQGQLRKEALRGTLNGGGQALVLQTSGGSIHLRKPRK
ncbi:MAG: DUF4097 family beta strand repeat-containing protein [Acidobacteria bacterium]|nr:DUF4097 family beta strand repeat-containing protein [Acidobacteriota bacterium]